MTKDNSSPEEKLFKIIQQEKGSSSGSGKDSRKNSTALWIKNAARIFSSLKDKVISLTRSSAKSAGGAFPGKMPEIQLETVNITLSTVLSFIIIFVIYYAVAKYPNIASAAARAQIATPSASYQEIEPLKGLEYYTEGPRRRNIFAPGQKVAAVSTKPVISEGGKGAGGNLKLQGIAWSDVPKVILQAEKDSKQYILKEGQSVGTTGIKVKKIFRNKVRLTDGESDFELL